MTRVLGAVLAAGAGSRMGGPKADLVVRGVRLLDRAITALREGGCDPVLAVVRVGTAAPGAVAVVNPEPDRGMRSSLQCAVDAAATESETEALAVLLVDLPGVGAAIVRTVVDAWRPGRIVAARFGTRRGHPIVMAVPLWREALALAGPDEGARALLRARPEIVDDIDIATDPAAGADLDTPADLAAWTTRGPNANAARS